LLDYLSENGLNQANKYFCTTPAQPVSAKKLKEKAREWRGAKFCV